MSTPLYILCTSQEKRKNLYQYNTKAVLINNIDEFIQQDKLINIKSLLLLHTRELKNPQDDIQAILDFNPKTLIMLIEENPSFSTGSKYLQLGIKGYAKETMSAQQILQALSLIDEGNVWLYPEFVTQMISNMSVKEEKRFKERTSFSALTPSERKIAHLVAKGLSNKEVAIESKITERTVKAHLSAVFKKLEISDRLTLALLLK